ncbi:MAG: TRZ/ATZ family hydrolase [Burkholderiaceae bacterium]|nr:MAG: TRZ/ATZ family hydrolase [Burkholderiaceae bacterium]
MQAIDTLIIPRWIVPIEPAHTVLSDHALAIDQGRIVALEPTAQALSRFAPRETIRRPQHVLLPGLVNLHTHAGMTLLRGVGDDLPLMQWLQTRIWPLEGKLLSDAFVTDGTALACMEMLQGGVTTFNDMYFYPEAAVHAAQQAGMRIAASIIVIDFPSAYAPDADSYLNQGLALRDTLNDEPLVSFCLAPHAPYSVSDAAFARVQTLSEQLNLPVHVHLHETQTEIEDSLRHYGCRPLARLERLGLLGPQLIGVHAVHLTPLEIEQLAQLGCHLAHCPSSNLKLGSGIAATAAWREAGINFGLGTDSSASNNRLDLWSEMRLSALLAKGSTGNATAASAMQTLQAATLDGARALGLEQQIGSLVPGKAADLCLVNLGEPSSQPIYDVLSHLVYVAGREQVSDVWVAGQQRIVAAQYHDPAHKAALMARLAAWQPQLKSL